jgi:Uma2 family endonuclease
MAANALTEAMTHQPSSAPIQPVPPLPLEPGDRLTRDEFERRYDAMPEVKKAELIEGVVYMPSPVRYNSHGKPHSDIHGLLFSYSVATPGVELADNTTLRLDADNDPQPDLILRIGEAHGGKSFISEDDYLEGSPELIVEIASSSASYDLHEKFKVYRRNGVQEYLVWRVHDRQIDWFSLQDGKYAPLTPDDQGIIESLVFPGLRLNVIALLSEDLAKALEDLRQGIGSTTHTEFVQNLASISRKE